MFHQKFKKLLEQLQKCTFGQTYACLYSIECQKRGLPHAHILLCITIDNKIKREENNLFISAEILDKNDDAELHGLVMAHIIYDPCGSINHNSPCMVESKYSKQFPKAFLHCTEQGSHSYRSTSIASQRMVGILERSESVGGFPYNPFLLRPFNSHINGEICSSIKSIKYVVKYITKGLDLAVFHLQRMEQEGVAACPVSESSICWE